MARRKTNIRQLRQRIAFWVRRGYVINEASVLASMNLPVSSNDNKKLAGIRNEFIKRRRDLLRFYSNNGLTNAQIWKILEEVRTTFEIREEIFDISPTAVTPERLERAGIGPTMGHKPRAGLFEAFPDNEADVMDTLEYIEQNVRFDKLDRTAFESWQKAQEIIPKDQSTEEIELEEDQ